MNRRGISRMVIATSAALLLLGALAPAQAEPAFPSDFGRLLPSILRETEGQTPLVYAQAHPEAVGLGLARGVQATMVDEDRWLSTLHAGSPTTVQPRLVQILTNQTGRPLLLRQKAAIALGIVGHPTSVTVEEVRRQLQLESEPMLLSLLWLISGWSVDAIEAMPQVLELRANTSVEVRFMAGLAERQLNGSPGILPSEASSTVRGRALHVARNRPGDFTGRPGVWLPATPAAGVPVYFLGASGLFQSVTDLTGAYEIRLPPGTYDVATLTRVPDLSQPAVELLVQRNAGGDLQPVQVQKGQTIEVDPAATAAYPD